MLTIRVLTLAGARRIIREVANGEARSAQPKDSDRRAWWKEPRHLAPWLILCPALGMFATAGYAAAAGGWLSLALGSLVALAALLAGAVVGFIFAVPKPIAPAAVNDGSAPDARSGLISNDNLVEVSDWLTKILVGLGLVQFGRALDGGGVIIDAVAGALGTPAGAKVFAGAVLFIYALVGFLSVYILTRVYVGPLFALSDQALRIRAEAKVEEIVATRIAALENTVDEHRSRLPPE